MQSERKKETKKVKFSVSILLLLVLLSNESKREIFTNYSLCCLLILLAFYVISITKTTFTFSFFWASYIVNYIFFFIISRERAHDFSLWQPFQMLDMVYVQLLPIYLFFLSCLYVFNWFLYLKLLLLIRFCQLWILKKLDCLKWNLRCLGQ